MIKAIIAGLVAATVLSACRKDHTCACTVTTTGTRETTTSAPLIGIDTSVTTPLNTVNNNKSTMYKVSKRQAKYNCFDKTESVDESDINNLQGLATITTHDTGERSYSCSLK